MAIALIKRMSIKIQLFFIWCVSVHTHMSKFGLFRNLKPNNMNFFPNMSIYVRLWYDDDKQLIFLNYWINKKIKLKINWINANELIKNY